MHAMGYALLTTACLWLAEPPPDGPPPEGGRPPRGDVEIDVDFGRTSRDRGRRGGGPPPHVFRDGDRWVIEGVALILPAGAEDEKAPFDPEEGVLKLKLADGREIEVRPSRMPPGPPGGGPPRDGRGGPPREGRGGPRGERGDRPGPPSDRPFGPPDGPPPGPPEDLADGRPPGPPDGPHPPFPLGPPHGPGGPDGILGSELRPSEPPRELMELERKERDLEHSIRQAAREARESLKAPADSQAAAEKEKVHAELRGQIVEQFELRQRIRNMVLDKIRRDLTRIEESIGKRESMRESLIDQRLNDLLDQASVDF